jgi:hypothetical protein
MDIAPRYFIGILSLILALAAVAFYGRFRGPHDRLDELRYALSGIKNRLPAGNELIGVYSLTDEAETSGYVVNALVPASGVPQSLAFDTTIFVLPAANRNIAQWDSLRSNRLLIDSAGSEHYVLFLSIHKA